MRRISLDELPQLLNVLRGEMSLVGPRPLVPDEDALIEGWQRRRLAVKPGMTGLWQIFGSARIPMQEMVKIDYLYGANWSIWLDMKILLRTIPYILPARAVNSEPRASTAREASSRPRVARPQGEGA